MKSSIGENRVKILFVTASVSGGGAERVLINIINSLSLDRYEIVLMNTSMELAPKQLKDGVRYYCCNKVNARKAFGKVLTVVRQFKPNYTFTTSSNIGYMLILMKMFVLSKFKVIIRVAVPPSEYPINDFKTKILRTISKVLYKYAYKIVAQTEFMKQDVISHYNVKQSNVEVIRNIIDIPFLDEQGDNLRPICFKENIYNIVASGALYSIKGFDVLLKAFSYICKDRDNVYLYILGEERYEIGYKQKLVDLANSLNISGKVQFIGHLDNPYPYYKFADLFVMSSRKEGFPNVVLETLYYKTPVVATNCVDFTGVITSGVNGYVVTKNSDTALYIGILNAIENISKPCITEIENYNYEDTFV